MKRHILQNQEFTKYSSYVNGIVLSLLSPKNDSESEEMQVVNNSWINEAEELHPIYIQRLSKWSHPPPSDNKSFYIFLQNQTLSWEYVAGSLKEGGEDCRLEICF